MLRLVQSLQRPQLSILFLRRYCDIKIPSVPFNFVKEKVLNNKLLLVDIREPIELKEEGRVPNSVNIPLKEITEAFKMKESEFQKKYGTAKPSLTSDFVLMCRSGKRTTPAFKTLKELGFENVSVYSGSFLDWVEKGGPIEK